MGKFVDLTGQRFGKLVVIGRVEKPDNVKNGTFWLCKCDCGNKKIVNGNHLKDGNTQSCGCLYNQNQRSYNIQEYGKSNFDNLYGKYKHGAKNRNLEFLLSKEYFKDLTSSNCYYCGKSPEQINHQTGRFNGYYLYNGIDRLNNNIGYIEGNCVPCCKECNFAKRKMTEEEFFINIERIYNYKIKNNE